jgi:hypothetical protein
MKSKLLKEEALDLWTKNPKIHFGGYDQPLNFIKQLYKFGAKKVYAVSEYADFIDKLEDYSNIDTLYVVVRKNISVELAVFIAGSCRADEVSYLKQHKAIRLWWD